MWQSTVCLRSPPSCSMVSSTRWASRSQPGRWIDSGTPDKREAREAPRSTFSSAAVKSLLMPISPISPAAAAGAEPSAPQSVAICWAMSSIDIALT